MSQDGLSVQHPSLVIALLPVGADNEMELNTQHTHSVLENLTSEVPHWDIYRLAVQIILRTTKSHAGYLKSINHALVSGIGEEVWVTDSWRSTFLWLFFTVSACLRTLLTLTVLACTRLYQCFHLVTRPQTAPSERNFDMLMYGRTHETPRTSLEDFLPMIVSSNRGCPDRPAVGWD